MSQLVVTDSQRSNVVLRFQDRNRLIQTLFCLDILLDGDQHRRLLRKAERDVLKHLTTIAPDENSNGSSQGRGTVQIRSVQKPSSMLVIDGFCEPFGKVMEISYLC